MTIGCWCVVKQTLTHLVSRVANCLYTLANSIKIYVHFTWYKYFFCSSWWTQIAQWWRNIKSRWLIVTAVFASVEILAKHKNQTSVLARVISWETSLDLPSGTFNRLLWAPVVRSTGQHNIISPLIMSYDLYCRLYKILYLYSIDIWTWFAFVC